MKSAVSGSCQYDLFHQSTILDLLKLWMCISFFLTDKIGPVTSKREQEQTNTSRENCDSRVRADCRYILMLKGGILQQVRDHNSY